MSTYAYPKFQFAVWDGTNLAEIQEFVATAYVETDGTLWISNFGGAQIAPAHGVYVVGVTGGYTPESYTTESDFLARYSPTEGTP